MLLFSSINKYFKLYLSKFAMYVTVCEYVYINFFSAEWSLEHFGNDFLKMVWPISPFVQRYFCMPDK